MSTMTAKGYSDISHESFRHHTSSKDQRRHWTSLIRITRIRYKPATDTVVDYLFTFPNPINHCPFFFVRPPVSSVATLRVASNMPPNVRERKTQKEDTLLQGCNKLHTVVQALRAFLRFRKLRKADGRPRNESVPLLQSCLWTRYGCHEPSRVLCRVCICISYGHLLDR